MKVIDLFCGAGGMSRGFEHSEFEVVLGIDHNENAIETYNHNHPESEGIHGDITEMKPEDLDIDKDEIDGVVGGPPCPTFSLVGRSKINSIDGQNNRDDDRHQLYQHYLRFVDYFEPKFFVMENVKGMLSAKTDDDSPVVEVILDEMKGVGDGYNVNYQVLNSADYGVPQKRERLFFIGNRLGVENPDMTEWETHRPPESEDEKDVKIELDYEFPRFEKNLDDKTPWQTVADGIIDLPPVVSDGETPPTQMSEYTLPPMSKYQKWVREDVGDEELDSHVCRGHNMRDLTIYKILGEGVSYKIGDLPEEHQPYRTDIFPDKIKKQNPKEPSSTVVAHLYKDGHMFVHPREARSITVREAARLQSFKDDFEFPVARTHAYKQVGNAVPPLLASAVSEAIKTEILN